MLALISVVDELPEAPDPGTMVCLTPDPRVVFVFGYDGKWRAFRCSAQSAT